jgi:hypothetical protein
VVLCRFGGSRAGKTLAFSRPSRTDTWCRCLLVWSCSSRAFFSVCVLSPYITSGILPMSPPDAQVFVVSFSDNEQVCLLVLVQANEWIQRENGENVCKVQRGMTIALLICPLKGTVRGYL